MASPPPLRALIERALHHVATYRESVAERPVAPPVDVSRLRAALGGELAASGLPALEVIDQLAAGAEPGLTATTGPRYFGFVTGGALDAATGADLLTTGWDQSAFDAVTSPAAAVVEEIVGGWLKQLFGLPAPASFGLVSGGQAGNTVAPSASARSRRRAITCSHRPAGTSSAMA